MLPEGRHLALQHVMNDAKKERRCSAENTYGATRHAAGREAGVFCSFCQTDVRAKPAQSTSQGIRDAEEYHACGSAVKPTSISPRKTQPGSGAKGDQVSAPQHGMHKRATSRENTEVNGRRDRR